MFVYSEVSVEIQESLFTEGCQDYIRVEKVQNDTENTENNSLPCPWNSSSCLLVRKFQQYAERIRNFKVLSDDIWIVTYPKCGTTWAQEMFWLLANGLDFETAKAQDINQRSPYLEISSIGTNLPFDSIANIEENYKQRPRIIKSHLPLNLLPEALFKDNNTPPKVIYVTRNAKDAAVSYYHHYRMLLGYRGDLNTFLDGFLRGNVLYGDHISHTRDFVRLSKSKCDQMRENLLIIRYEDMVREMPNVLQKTNRFLHNNGGGGGGPVLSGAQLDAMQRHLSFEQMRKNGACNNEAMSRNAMDMNGRKGQQFNFLRKGKVGTYVEEMPQEFVAQFDDVAAKESCDDLRFYISAAVE